MLHLSDLGRLIGDHRYIGVISVYLYVVEMAGLGDTVYIYIYEVYVHMFPMEYYLYVICHYILALSICTLIYEVRSQCH